MPQNIQASESDSTCQSGRSLGAGFKAYVTQRAFLRSDVRFLFSDRLEEALLRFGFGVDF